MAQRVVVLGGGPAGDVAALRAAQMGADVVLVERRELGGTCLNRGCVPSKALLAISALASKIQRAHEFGLMVDGLTFDFPRMQERKDEIVLKMRQGVEAACRRKKVKVVQEQGRLDGGAVVAGGVGYPYDHLIVCVGTEPSGLPGIDMSHPRVITSDGVWTLKEIPKRLLIIGGGVIGCEFASLFAPLGSQVTVVEMLPQLLAGVDRRTAQQFQRLLEGHGVRVHLESMVEKVDYGEESITATLSDGTDLEASTLLVAVGRTPQTLSIGLEEAGVTIDARGHLEVDEFLRTGNESIWAAGDCIGGLQLAHLASAEAARAAENALDPQLRRPMDRTVVPNCIFTSPEIATVGLHADLAREAGHEVKIGQARFVGEAKALAEGEPEGYVQLVADAQDDRLLGATIMGPHAVELIHEVGVAISDGFTMAELGDVIHAHPTVSEVVMDAAQQGHGVAPYLS
ncbi:MAG: dihydrolipoyl dehydrogenase [Candidatus Dormibacteraeota bacterium]|nr:dihydrolipoyl dehydrogenase [Candidatus Dormibacteraeota bacterium]